MPPKPSPPAPPPASTLEDFNKAIAANPKDAAAHLGRGNLYLAKLDYDKAIADFDKALQLDPALADAHAKRQLAAKERIKAQPIPGYKQQAMEGFHVIVAQNVITHNDDADYERKPLDVLRGELEAVVKLLPKRAVKALHAVPIWVEWHDDKDPDIGKSVAKYYGASGNLVLWALDKQKNPLKANSVEIIDMKALAEEHQPKRKLDRSVLLHEFSHAVHFQLFGADNPQIKAAYQQAMDRNLYDTAKDVNNREIKPYARTNEREYFAELSCAYFSKLHYFPFTRDDLKKHDPVGYKMMELTWGKANP
jgi:tetratricopeptide (TPR) repeat protein